MNLLTISEVSKNFNISTRTLRYYEQIGILQSKKKEDYAYRTYDQVDVRRLQQIIVLRKLRISLKQIKAIFQNTEQTRIVEIFLENISGIDNEIAALSTIKNILNSLIERLSESTKIGINLDLLQDYDILKVVETLGLSKINLKGEKSMEELNKANENLSKLQDKDVRIIYLPPATVASVHCIGGLPEIETGNLLNKFIIESKLYDVKPDFRHYGFNNPNGNIPDGSDHGYERWITIPEGFEVKAPSTKKYFQGGLYCAYMISMGAFDEWSRLYNWAQNNDKYELNYKEEMIEPQCMEEHLNYINKYMLSPEDSTIQIDLLLPVKEKVF
ncbi:MerR family transcriptional regulator [Clostridium folliculivorans]|uniref:MerR family transcriptional regulator n=1 Tax=Clostridium folliculivorans TaxID=2886038 RepID=A0A9W5Y4W4_9CLOT|nr:MerR family transcriptional regulator [Clostridium folliculivorans]GKU26644.1 MerR family transcriptional regulator [Clostridium folliculivorans]GKU28924.1 MerR family transcriptional regulator [Clostridium folliculivorans]